MIDNTAKIYGQARITFTSSVGYKKANRLDTLALTTQIPNDGTSLLHLKGAFQRYLDSKLAVLYLAMALAKEVWTKNSASIFVNACHPGKHLVRCIVHKTFC
jgi:NAD(P)-dependent dehydrogenase (short-subunit alcohol dehydrogenase family)